MAPSSSDAGSTPKQPDWPEPSETAHAQYQREIYAGFSEPILSTRFSEWEAGARAQLPKSNFNYVYGAAGLGRTNAANVSAFERYRIKPSMLRDCTVRDTSVEIFGTKYASPIMVAPIGVQGIVHADGEEATARACASLGINYILSTAATRSIEQIAKANGPNGQRWFQLYWPRPQYEDITASLLARAKTEGYKVLVVTLDTFNLAWRPEDLDQSYLPFLRGQGCQIGFSDPVWQQRYEAEQTADTRSAGEKVRELWTVLKQCTSVSSRAWILSHLQTLQKSKHWVGVMNSGTYRKWQDLAILKKLWDGPIVLKGIQTLEDAHRAIEHGMAGIIVSNHGGRQCDGAIASLDALAAIGADDRVKSSGLAVLFDSGVRSGSDVLKALALGAKAVLVGRPVMYGLALAGQAGAEHVLKCFLADMDISLANAGKKNLAELSRFDLQFFLPAKL